MARYQLTLALALFCTPLAAQTMGAYAMVPIVRDEPYIVERVSEMRDPVTAGSKSAEEVRSTFMRDSKGRLREQTKGSPPNEGGSSQEPWVRILDPLSMMQTDLDVSHRTYRKSVIPEQVRRYRSRLAFCAGPSAQTMPDGSVTRFRYERLRRATVEGVAADGCRLTVNGTAIGSSYVTELWRSADLQIDLSRITHYDNGREDLSRVVSLRRVEPDETLFRVPSDYTDAAAPPNRINFNPNLGALAEYGSIEWHTSTATLVAAGSDAASEAARTLRDCLGLAVSSERPFQPYLGDLLDTTDPTWASKHTEASNRAYAGRPAAVRIDFRTLEDGRPSDPGGLVHAVANALNREQSYEWAADTIVRPHFTMYALVPHATHDEQGHLIHPKPYMEEPIDLSEQEGTVASLAVQLATQLSEKTAYQFSCCQTIIAGQMWGSTPLRYRATHRPAREVFADLMDAEGRTKAYSAACEPHSRKFCFIIVQAVRPSPNRTGVCRIPSYNPSR